MATHRPSKDGQDFEICNSVCENCQLCLVTIQSLQKSIKHFLDLINSNVRLLKLTNIFTKWSYESHY
jgi:hypothetical protein